MKKLLFGFGALLATGCTQPNAAHVEPSSIRHHYRVYAFVDDGARSPARWTDDSGEWDVNSPKAVRALVDLACIEVERAGGPAEFTCGEPFYTTGGGTRTSVKSDLMAGRSVSYYVHTGAYHVGFLTLD